jgi:hypothetical protein
MRACGGCYLSVQHVDVIPATLVDVLMATATAEALRVGCFLRNTERWADRRHRVLLGNDEQDRNTDPGGAAHRPVCGDTEERTGGDAVLPVGRLSGGHEPANDVPQAKIRLVSMSGCAAAQPMMVP